MFLFLGAFFCKLFRYVGEIKRIIYLLFNVLNRTDPIINAISCKPGVYYVLIITTEIDFRIYHVTIIVLKRFHYQNPVKRLSCGSGLNTRRLQPDYRYYDDEPLLLSQNSENCWKT